jgi:hypothetical protein
VGGGGGERGCGPLGFLNLCCSSHSFHHFKLNVYICVIESIDVILMYSIMIHIFVNMAYS